MRKLTSEIVLAIWISWIIIVIIHIILMKVRYTLRTQAPESKYVKPVEAITDITECITLNLFCVLVFANAFVE